MPDKINPAVLDWGEDGVPRSIAYGDLYFSAENGLEESKHVFLQGNKLSERWSALKPGGLFTICETGFGSGLNLLAAAQAWQASADPEARLHFISIEQHPMLRDDLTRAHKGWQELAQLSALLTENYPALTPGFHHFQLNAKIAVTLIFDDIESALENLCPPLEPQLWDHNPYTIDAWFLDGFSPAKNPDMWKSKLFSRMHRLSKPGTTLATFTASGDVRRQLCKWGFDVKKLPGFGRKREMICASYDPSLTPDLTTISVHHKKPLRCWTLTEPEISSLDTPVAIIGAGIAGATLASALAKRGRRVIVYDSASEPASQASGIPQVALYGKLSPDAGDLEDFVLTATQFSQYYYQKLFQANPQHDLGDLCGLIQIARDDTDLARMTRIADRLEHCKDFVELLDPVALRQKSGLTFSSSGLYFPGSGWLNGAAVCSALLSHKNIQVSYNTTISKITRSADTWELTCGENQNDTYSQLVVCTAGQNKNFYDLDWLPTRTIRGQVSLLPTTAPLSDLKTVLCREIQLAPNSGGYHCTGSTYGLDDADTSVRNEDHASNLEKLETMLRESLDVNFSDAVGAASIDKMTIQARAALRCATPDYIPITGPVPSYQAFLTMFSRLRKDAKSQLPLPCPVESGLFINLGYGSRGYTYAPLCAELLASQLCREVPPLPGYLRESLHPARFLVRGLIRNTL